MGMIRVVHTRKLLLGAHRKVAPFDRRVSTSPTRISAAPSNRISQMMLILFDFHGKITILVLFVLFEDPS